MSGRPNGWDAIRARFESINGSQSPLHWADSAFGFLDPDRIEAVQAWDAGDHRHLVTLGLSDIWGEGDDSHEVAEPAREHTLRFAKDPELDAPPDWALRLMVSTARAALQGGKFLHGHTLDPHGSITGKRFGKLRALAFVRDPRAGEVDTPNGTVEFIQVVGTTRRQMLDLMSGRIDIEALSGSDGLYITRT